MKLNWTKTGDGRLAITRPIYRSFNTQADADKFEAWLVAFACRAAGRIVTEDELFKGGVAHPDPRSDYDKTKAKELRRFELEALRPKAAPKSTDEQIDDYLSEKVEQAELSKLTTAQRMQLQHRRDMAQRQAADAAQTADAALRGKPEFVKAATEIELNVLAAKFNPRLTQAEVENLEHLQSVLNVTGNLGLYAESKKVFDIALRERVHDEQARQIAALDQRTRADLMMLSVSDAEAEPVPEPVNDTPRVDRVEPAGWDSRNQPLVRLHHNKGETVVSKFLHELNLDNPEFTLKVVEDNPNLVREVARPAPQPEPAQ